MIIASQPLDRKITAISQAKTIVCQKRIQLIRQGTFLDETYAIDIESPAADDKSKGALLGVLCPAPCGVKHTYQYLIPSRVIFEVLDDGDGDAPCASKPGPEDAHVSSPDGYGVSSISCNSCFAVNNKARRSVLCDTREARDGTKEYFARSAYKSYLLAICTVS